MPNGREEWLGGSDVDARYGNFFISKEEYLDNFERRVLKEHPEFSPSVLAEFRKFYDLWEQELERTEQISAQGAHKRLIHFLKT